MTLCSRILLRCFCRESASWRIWPRAYHDFVLCHRGSQHAQVIGKKCTSSADMVPIVMLCLGASCPVVTLIHDEIVFMLGCWSGKLTSWWRVSNTAAQPASSVCSRQPRRSHDKTNARVQCSSLHEACCSSQFVCLPACLCRKSPQERRLTRQFPSCCASRLSLECVRKSRQSCGASLRSIAGYKLLHLLH